MTQAATDTYRTALEAIAEIANGETKAEDVLQTAVELLHARFAHYSWVGVYLVAGNDLVLGPWRGPPRNRAHTDPNRSRHLRGCVREWPHRDRRRRQR
jgi:putative methionine-R-sulfoxide reductase with GAF domain